MIVENIISGNVIINLGCALVDNHIYWDDIFDYQPIKERNICIIFPIYFLSKGDIFHYFTNLINSKLISELVSSDETVFLCNNATQV